jgi:hypothetical protein
MAGPLNGKTGEFLRWVIGIIGVMLVSYYTAQNSTNERLTKIETRWESIRESLVRIESRLDRRDEEDRQRYADWLNGIDRRTGEPLPLQRAIEQGR